MPRPLIFLFPGQSSRDPEMLERLEAVHGGVAKRARQRIQARLQPGAPNSEVQLNITTLNLTYLELANTHGLAAQASAGMSLGEYSHLVHIGAIEAEACLDLIAARGRAYDAGPSGATSSSR